jgi:hypothetical protein
MAQDSASMNPSKFFLSRRLAPCYRDRKTKANIAVFALAGEPTGPKVDVPPANNQNAGQDAAAPPKVKSEKECMFTFRRQCRLAAVMFIKGIGR